jgi:YggT family protein
MNTIIFFLIQLLNVYLWLIIVSVMVSWLVVFGVLNTRNKWVYKFCALLNRVTSPGMDKLRSVIPPMGGIDFTPMVMIFGIYLLQSFLYNALR